MQSFFLHGLFCSSGPLHGTPPGPGAGSVQVRYRVSCPSPQDLEHRDHGDQLVHSPENSNDNNDNYNNDNDDDGDDKVVVVVTAATMIIKMMMTTSKIQ